MQTCKNLFIQLQYLRLHGYPLLFAVLANYDHCHEYLKMTNLEKARLELTESQLLTIKDRIKSWSTKDQVIDIMRYRYGRVDDQAA